MIALCIASILIVILGVFRYSHYRRSLAERTIDRLYTSAAVIYSLAQAVDAGLVSYRSTRQKVRESHIPMYALARE